VTVAKAWDNERQTDASVFKDFATPGAIKSVKCQNKFCIV
jgi:hypothetical protein